MCLMFWNDKFLEFNTLTLDSNISKARIFIEVPAGKFTSRHNRRSIKLYFSGLAFRQRSSVQYIEKRRWGNIFGWVWSLRKHRTEKQQYCSSSTNEMILLQETKVIQVFLHFADHSKYNQNDPNWHRLHKIWPVVDYITDNCLFTRGMHMNWWRGSFMKKKALI